MQTHRCRQSKPHTHTHTHSRLHRKLLKRRLTRGNRQLPHSQLQRLLQLQLQLHLQQSRHPVCRLCTACGMWCPQLCTLHPAPPSLPAPCKRRNHSHESRGQSWRGRAAAAQKLTTKKCKHRQSQQSFGPSWSRPAPSCSTLFHSVPLLLPPAASCAAF